ncbi:glycosyltransferase 87 family protein [Rhodococcus sp. AW25M09]|uniref:glycosyltransferase 87 family protein n=1 Tax=Rhodococcus sp. AW25M09 TaxID=1268303 RepID=UPI0003452082
MTSPDTNRPIAEASDQARPTPRRWPSWVVASSRILVVAAAAVGVLFHLNGFPGLRALGEHYRLDLDVYRLGGQVFAEGGDLYGQLPPIATGTTLPFTYPPIAAALFSPLSSVSLYDASITVTALSMILLLVTVVATLTSLGVRPRTVVWWSAGAVFAVSVLVLEPVTSTLNYGQINIVLMTFVALDCLPKKTPWPRGVLIGLVAAVKLTPAVFVLFFLLRKDFRAAVMSVLSFAVFTAIGFALTWSDSVKYWTETIVDSDRIGGPAYPPNQSITGVLARLGMDELPRSILWLALSVVVLIIAAVAMRKAFAADEIALALTLNAMLGLLVSPVSWSHHWVWAVPFTVVLAVLGYRRRSALLLGLVAVGLVLMVYPPHWKLSEGRSSGLGWPLIDQFAASAYVWWALASIVALAAIDLAGRTEGARSPAAIH